MYQKQESPPSYPLDIRVIIEREKNKDLVELLEQVDIGECLDENNNILLKKLVILVKNQYNFPFQNKQIYYYLTDVDLYMNCGIDPINEDIRIRPENFQKNTILTLKAKDLGISMVHRLMSFQNTNNAADEKERNGADEMAQRSKCRRTKERRIGHIIDKVIEWRKYYSGTTNEKNQPVKYSLEDAAKEVKISKKSLDDYLFQIRFGHRYGFNFNEHYNDKVGVLRDFVRQKKKNDKTEVKNRKNAQRVEDRND